MKASRLVGCTERSQRDSYFGHTSFATTRDDLKHLTRIDAVFTPFTSQLCDLHYHFDDRKPILGAGKDGKCCSVPIYESSGEQLIGIEIAWSDVNRAIGCNVSSSLFLLHVDTDIDLKLITTERPRIILCSGDMLASDPRTQRLTTPLGSFMTSIFRQTKVSLLYLGNKESHF